MVSKDRGREPSPDAQRIAGQAVVVEHAEDGHQREAGARDLRHSDNEEPVVVPVEAHEEVAVAVDVPAEAHVEVAVAVEVVEPDEVVGPWGRPWWSAWAHTSERRRKTEAMREAAAEP